MASFESKTTRISLSWPLKSRMPTVADEEAIVSTLIENAKENGRGVDLPVARQEKIAAAAECLGFLLSGAMSYRRQLIRQASRSDAHYWSKNMQMGDATKANEYSAMFEDLVATFLHSSGVIFQSEKELKLMGSQNTPDFFIPDGCLINNTLVYWIDCKTFYGAATLAGDSKQPIGKLLPTAERYNSQFGEG